MMDAEITAVDVKSRRVTLKLPNGDLVDLLVGNQVKNLSQVKVGDIVVAEYQQALWMKKTAKRGLSVLTDLTPGPYFKYLAGLGLVTGRVRVERLA